MVGSMSLRRGHLTQGTTRLVTLALLASLVVVAAAGPALACHGAVSTEARAIAGGFEFEAQFTTSGNGNTSINATTTAGSVTWYLIDPYSGGANGAVQPTSHGAGQGVRVVVSGLNPGEGATATVTALTGGASDCTGANTSPLSTSRSLAGVAGAPTITAITRGDAQLSVAFTAPGNDGGSSITNYEYQLDGGAWVPRAPVSATSPLVLTGLTNGQQYEVRIRAVNGVGSGTQSNMMAGTPARVPDAPTITRLTAGDREISISFTPPAFNGGAVISNYRYSLDGGGTWTALSPPTTVSPVTLKELQNGTPLEVRLAAVNSVGAGAPSDMLRVTPSAPAPALAPALPKQEETEERKPYPVEIEDELGDLDTTNDLGVRVRFRGTTSDEGAEGGLWINPVTRADDLNAKGLTALGQGYHFIAEGFSFEGADVCVPFDQEAFFAHGRPNDRLRLIHEPVDGKERDITTRVEFAASDEETSFVCGDTDRFSELQIAVYAADRIAGGDRFHNAAAVALELYPDGSDTVFIAAGNRYPDALVAGTVASRHDAPLLLVGHSAVPEVIAQALAKLRPSQIFVIGGTAAVSEQAVSALAALTGANVEQIGGPDRFATAAMAALRFTPDVQTLYVASGNDFPDALTAGAAVVLENAAILLVPSNGLPAVVKEAIEQLSPKKIIVVGGSRPVGRDLVGELRRYAPTQRLSGPNRYETAVRVMERFDSPSSVVAVTGLAYPDALVAVTLAGRQGAPIILTLPHAVPDTVREALNELGHDRLTIVGGLQAVHAQAELELTRTLPLFVPERL